MRSELLESRIEITEAQVERVKRAPLMQKIAEGETLMEMLVGNQRAIFEYLKEMENAKES